MRTCKTCGIDKPLDQFYRHAKSVGGRRLHCKVCSYAGQRQSVAKNPEKVKEYGRKWRSDNVEKSKEYRLSRLEHILQINRESRRKKAAENPEKIREQHRKWRGENKHKLNEKEARRKARKGKASLGGISEAETIGIYSMARAKSEETGVQHHVDHIFPLFGKNSCGLHVAWNLRVITAEANINKNNEIEDGSVEDYRRLMMRRGVDAVRI